MYLKFIDYGEANTPLQVISFHGFPSIRSKQNRELAQGISEKLNCRVRVVLYPGLSTDGVFSFKKTIEALVSEFPKLANDENKTSKISLLGHSFGGFCALLVAVKHAELVDRIVLLSPLLKFATSTDQAAIFFRSVLGSDEQVRTLTPEQLAFEFQELSKTYRTEELIANLREDLEVKLLQAKDDRVTPTAIAEEFRKHFRCRFNFELVEQDHSFLMNRKKLSGELADLFRH